MVHTVSQTSLIIEPLGGETHEHFKEHISRNTPFEEHLGGTGSGIRVQVRGPYI